MYENLFAHIDIDPNNVHILNGEAENLEAECNEYEEKIKAIGGIELFLSKERDTAGADDGIEPGAEFGFAAEVGQGAIGFYENVLADLFGVFAVIREAKHEGEHELLIALDELAVQCLLSAQDFFNNLCVSEFNLCHEL